MNFQSRSVCVSATTSEGKNPKFLAINHDAISKEEVLEKVKVFKFTILKCLVPGFAKAPYKMKDKFKIKNAKPLSELTSTTVDGKKTIQGMKMYTYPKVGISDKGPRSDLSWTLVPGNTVKLWLDEERRSDDTLLAKSIPALSLCEISITSKTEESVKKGWCLKITNIRTADFSFHSIPTDLKSLCSSLGEAKAKELSDVASQAQLEKELETQAVAYTVEVGREAVLEENEGQVRLLCPGEPLPIEVPLEILTRVTNCHKVAWACALLEISIAAGAVTMLVVANDFWKGSSKGIPIINFTALVNWQPPLDPTSQDATNVYRLPFTVDVDDEKCFVDLEVGTETISVSGTKPPACEDFALTGLDVELSQAIPVQFNLVKRSGEVHAQAVWKGYYNASPSLCAVAGGSGKRKWLHESMNE